MRVADISGTATTHVAFELAPVRGTTATDQTIDQVFVDGTAGNDVIGVSAAGHEVRATGLPATVTTTRSDPTLDRLHVNTKAGDDHINLAPNVNQLIGFTWSQ